MNSKRNQSGGNSLNKMGDVLAGLMARKGYAQLQTAEDLQTAWADAVGAQLAENSLAGKVARGKLEILVNNSAVLQAISFNKVNILKKLNDAVPEHGIEDIRVKVGKID